MEWRKTMVTIDGTLGPYPAEIQVGNRWNGWVVPRFTRDVAARIVDDVNKDNEDTSPGDRNILSWDGDNVIMHCESYADQEGYEPEVVEPLDGFYGIGAFSWCWSEADPSNVVTFFGTLDVSALCYGKPNNGSAEIDAFREAVRALLKAWPGVRLMEQEWVPDGDTVAAAYEVPFTAHQVVSLHEE